MKVRARGVLVVAALTLGACSGESAAPATTVPETTASTSPTTPPPTAPATTPTTAPPATTPPTTAPPTTPATVPPTVPATIPADLAQAQQDVIDATSPPGRPISDATRDPSNEEKLARLAATPSGPTLERRSTSSPSWWQAASSPSRTRRHLPSIDIYEETVVVDVAAGTASVEYCRIGSDLGIEVGGNPDGTDKIVVNEVNAYHERSELVFIEDAGSTTTVLADQKFAGSRTCGV